MEKHQHTYLSEPTWTQIPWKEKAKAPFDEVLDFLILAPAIFKAADELPNKDSPDLLPSVLKILGQCWKMDVALRTFYEKLQRSIPGPLYWPRFSEVVNPADDAERGKVFPIAFHFPHLRLATTLMFYWSTTLMLWNGMTQLYGVLFASAADEASSQDQPNRPSNDPSVEDSRSSDDEYPPPPDPIALSLSRLPPLEHRKNYLSMGRNICQSVEFCMQDTMLAAGPISVSAPLAIVIEYFKGSGGTPAHERELSWAIFALDRVRKSELRILNYLQNGDKTIRSF